MNIHAYDSLKNLTSIQEIVSYKSSSDTVSVTDSSTSNSYDTVNISPEAIDKFNNSIKVKLADEYEDMRIYTAGYKDALSMIHTMVEEKKDAVDLASCGEYFLMMYHKAAIDNSLSKQERLQIQNSLEDGYADFMKLRAEKEGWDDGEGRETSTRGMIKAMGSKEYYNSYLTPVFEAIIKGDYNTALKLRGSWDEMARAERANQTDDEESARRKKELADAQEEKRRLDREIQIMKNI